MAIPSADSITGLDTSDQKTRGMSNGQSFGSLPQGGKTNVSRSDPTRMFDDNYLLKLAQEASSQSSTFLQQSVRAYWARSYKAFRNQHFEGSKYTSPEFNGRSKYFRPKTRTAVLKKLANAAQALFGTGDVVSITAEDQSNDLQVASAALKQELINYRLSRTSRRSGVRWFQTCMGALQTGQITGLCISKQSWRYREEDEQDDTVDENGMSRQPAIIEDRPSIDLLASENVLFDPNCDWTDPAQSSQYVIVRYPMSVDEAMTMIDQNVSSGNSSFLEIKRSDVQAHVKSMGPGDTVAPRTAREGGKDPKSQTSGNFGRVWIYEVFMRVGNTDMVYWTLDNQKMISKPVPVRKAYPAYGGERPIVIGYCAFEAFRPYPMSPVESWQQMQMETNDQINLRLDHMKQVVTPRAKVVRGKKIDLQQVQRQGPNGIVMVNDASDVEWWEPPDVPPSAYQENNLLTGDFDSLAGVFDAGSVANNREMNETVGGMRLLAGSTNPMGEFDLNVFVETWVEPVIWQLLKLEEYYESDPTILMIAGQRAQLWDKFGISEVTDELLTREATVNVKVGVGSSSLPEERIKKFASAASVVMGVLEVSEVRMLT